MERDHALTHSLTHSLTRSLPHSLTPTHPPQNETMLASSLYRIVCTGNAKKCQTKLHCAAKLGIWWVHYHSGTISMQSSFTRAMLHNTLVHVTHKPVVVNTQHSVMDSLRLSKTDAVLSLLLCCKLLTLGLLSKRSSHAAMDQPLT